jgi:hypothetical protein
MSCLGVHFALTKEEADQFLAFDDEDEALAFLQEEIEGRWDEAWLQESAKAWDAIHRCLTDGTLKARPLTTLHKCILGGDELYWGDDYIISFLSPEEVAEVAAALEAVDEGWMRKRYDELDPEAYRHKSDDDFEYTWNWFWKVRAFFGKAARHGRAVVFTADQ